MAIIGWVKGSKVYYPISQLNDEKPTCPCKGYLFRSYCRHITDYNEGKYCLGMRFQIVVTDDYGLETTIEGEQRFNPDHLTTEELTDNLSKAQDFLTRLMGMKVELRETT